MRSISMTLGPESDGMAQCSDCKTKWPYGKHHDCPTCNPDQKKRPFELRDGRAYCLECGEVMRYDRSGTSETMVGFGQGACGRDHNDNCLLRYYSCPNGHGCAVSIQRTCPCGWRGKISCFCHRGEKVTEWPND